MFVAFLLVFLVIDRTLGASGGPDPQAGPTTSARSAPESTTAPTTTQPSTTTTTAPTTTAAPTTTRAPTTQAPTTTAPPTTRPAPPQQPPPEEDTTTRAPLPPAEGVTLQVLNGTGELRLARDFKPLARDEGYDIVNSANANGDYPVSTIYYTPGHRRDAQAFKQRFPAFEKVAPAPGNLSDDVALHAVLGKNYQP